MADKYLSLDLKIFSLILVFGVIAILFVLGFYFSHNFVFLSVGLLICTIMYGIIFFWKILMGYRI